MMSENKENQNGQAADFDEAMKNVMIDEEDEEVKS